jgi:hypothetical protein
MPRLPERPDLDQLRRQARELQRAAVAGEPHAIDRIRAVSPRLTLSAAQLALAREYGCRSWPALRAELERHQALAAARTEPPTGGVAPEPPPVFQRRWSFGGAAAIETATGTLLPEGLIAGDGRAMLYACLTPSESARKAVTLDSPSFAERLNAQGRALARAGDIAVIDDRGTTYTLRRVGTSSWPGWEQVRLEFRVDPVPGPDVRWIDLGGQNGTLARLPRSARVSARAGGVMPMSGNLAGHVLALRAHSAIYGRLSAPAESRDNPHPEAFDSLLARAAEAQRTGELEPASELPGQLARLRAALTGQGAADGLPASWAGMLAAADRADGPQHHLDIGLTLPPVDGVAIHVDSLFSSPGNWLVPLRITGQWPVEVLRDENGNFKDKRRSMAISAEDDRGNSYVSGSSTGYGRDGTGTFSFTFRPRLDPLARSLRLTVAGPSEQVLVDLDLSPEG